MSEMPRCSSCGASFVAMRLEDIPGDALNDGASEGCRPSCSCVERQLQHDTLFQSRGRRHPMRGIGGKYRVDEIYKISSGEVIPRDEPLFLFRAKDRLAIQALEHYLSICTDDGCNDCQLTDIMYLIDAFEDFRSKNPGRMKQPDSTKVS